MLALSAIEGTPPSVAGLAPLRRFVLPRVTRHSPLASYSPRVENPCVVEIRSTGDTCSFAVRVQARSHRDAIEGEWQGALKVRLTAPPVDDRANAALCRLLAARLNIPASAVRIIAGERSRTKRVEVRGVTAAQVRELIEAPPHG